MQINLGPLGQQNATSTTLLCVGGFTLAYIVFNAIRVVLSTLVLPGKPLSTFGPKGSWAVITGASDGIGKEYAFQLSRRGFNVLLVSRTQSKLSAVADQIKSTSPNVSVETLAIDFAQNLDKDYNSLEKAVSGKHVSILVNNVGASHSIPVDFAETPLEEMKTIINVNCIATLRVTQTVLPAMIPHKNGLILTMGSFGGLTPTPLLATYSGSKAFLQQWSNALAAELKPQGIMVHFVHSYLVTSAMSKVRRSNWQVPSEKDFVKSVLAKIGRRGGSVGYAHSGTPFWSHALVIAIVLGIWGPMNGALLDFNRNMHVKIRQRALKKAEKDKAKGKKES